MPRAKIEMPKESKAAVMSDIVADLEVKFGVNPAGACEYLLNFFTTADLVGIRAELRKK